MSEPQKWTPESVKELVGYDIGGSGVIARAHNAELTHLQEMNQITQIGLKNGEASLREVQQQLAAEREAWDKQFTATMTVLGETQQQLAASNSQLDDAGSHNAAADRELRELRQQLAAERERYALLLKSATRDAEQLLQAQAAMGLHNDINGDVCHIEANLDALKAHDAEVRKPLLDALEQIRDMSWHQVGKAAIYIADAALQADALAKVKEVK